MITPPPVETPMVDPKTGKLTPVWKRWFTNTYQLLSQGHTGSATLAKLATANGSITAINGIVTALIPPT